MTPVRDATVMLVMDTSGSMRAKDLQPSRIEVAQQAAQQFIEDKPRRLRVGLVTVAGTAALAQAPTEDRDVLLKALDYLPLQYGSALGTGILVSLEALLPGAGIDAQKIINESAESGGAKNQATSGQSLDDRKTAPNTANPSTGQGRQMAIVLMSDGQNNMGPELKQMADLAAAHQVKIYTVGIGTTEGDVVQMQGRSMRVKLEDEALKKVSAITQGEYFKADSVQALKSIYNQLGHRLRFEKRAMSEVTALSQPEFEVASCALKKMHLNQDFSSADTSTPTEIMKSAALCISASSDLRALMVSRLRIASTILA